jgi:hypothetical protein
MSEWIKKALSGVAVQYLTDCVKRWFKISDKKGD